MANQVVCPQGHEFEPIPGSPAVCPQCGTPQESAESATDVDETFRPLDELPPLPIPSSATLKSRIPFQLSGYEILEELGRGGMGVVYKARQLSLNRTVALKMMLGGTPEEWARFKTEADAFAQLRHPNIVQIYEIGERAGQPYLALEFVGGGTLAAHLAGVPFEPAVGAEFVEMLARAMHFAHMKQIVHRDLKPANILLTESTAASSGEKSALRQENWRQAVIPKITDFGLAKRMDQSAGPTRAGAVMGTPSYMAPEQAAGAETSSDPEAIGPATDVYALGAILYEMLAGRPPFRGVSPLETVRQVLHEDPVPPRRLQPGVPLDLETICLKCLEKDPGRRYTSADALADDLARFLAGQPILARPTGWHERAAKWIKRHRALSAFIVMCAIAALLSVAFSVGLYFNSRLQESLEETENQRARADGLYRLTRRYHYIGEMNQGQRFWRDRQTPRLLALLKAQRAPEADLPDLRSFEWHYLWRLCHGERFTFTEHQHAVTCVAYSPTESLVATGSGTSTLAGGGVGGFGEALLWDAGAGKVRHRLRGHLREVNAVAFSGNGQLLATASSDAIVAVWNVATGKRIHLLKGHLAPVASVAFHPSGNWLASGSRDGAIKIWDVREGTEHRTLARHREQVLSVAFNHDGTRLLSGGGDLHKAEPGEIWEWDTSTWKAIAEFHGPAAAVTAVAYNPDATSIAAASARSVHLWDRKSNAMRILAGHHDRVTCLAFDETSGRLASGSADRTVILWDVDAGRELYSRTGHDGTVRGVTFSSDGAQLISAAEDGVKIWEADGDQEFASLAGHEDHVTDAAFESDGTRLATASLDQTVRVWDLTRRARPLVLAGHAGPAHCVAFVPAGRDWHVISGGDDGVLRFWNIDGGKEVHRAGTPGEQIHALALDRAGTRLAFGGVQNADAEQPATVTVLDAQTRKTICTFKGHASGISSIAFSPDGRRIVSASSGNRGVVKIWDAATGEEIVSIPMDHAEQARAVFSPDSRRIAIANGALHHGQVRIHDASTGKEELVLTGHSGMANALAFTPDGERLGTTAGELNAPSQIKLWDAATGQEVLSLRGPTGLVRSLAFSGDGRRLVGVGGPLTEQRGEIILWDANLKGN